MDIIEILDKISSYNDLIEENTIKINKLEEEFYSKYNPLLAKVRGLEKEREELINNIDRNKLLKVSIKELIKELSNYLWVHESDIDVKYIPMMKIYDNYNDDSRQYLINDVDLLNELNYRIVFNIAGITSIEIAQNFDINNKHNIYLFKKHAKFKKEKNSKYLSLQYDNNYLDNLIISLTYYDLLFTPPFSKKGSIIKDVVSNIFKNKINDRGVIK